jgi:hypothetical protein
MEKPNKPSLASLLGLPRAGQTAQTAGRTLNSWSLGLLPVINRLLERLPLEPLLRASLPPEDGRLRTSPAGGLLVLLKNLLLCRQRLSGVGQWAAHYDPDLLGLSTRQIGSLNDDRRGRGLDRLFQSDCSSLAVAVAAHAVTECDVDLDELHNDSTTVTFFGQYAGASKELPRGGPTRRAITWGQNKDHRPDLKPLLFILTVAKDGGVPVYFQAKSGHVVDDQTPRATWDLLCRRTGRRDFL